MASIVINNEDLRNTFNYVRTIHTALIKEFDKVVGNKSQLDKLVPEDLIGTYSAKYNKALEFKDNIISIAYDSGVVMLVASFERIVFAKYHTACGNLRGVLRDNASRPLDYFLAREKFINSSIDRLAAIIDLISAYLESDLHEKINLIREHRNYIAHGKRDREAPSVEMSLSDIAKALDDVIIEIENEIT